MFRVRIAERREDFSAGPEIGMIHMRAVRNFGETQRDLPKLRGRHGVQVMLPKFGGSRKFRTLFLSLLLLFFFLLESSPPASPSES